MRAINYTVLLKGICATLGVLIFSHPLIFSQPLYFENYTSEKGLSQNSCFAIEQDANGFMWFGTQDGLNRYDGKEFKIYLPQNTIGKTLPSNVITSLFFDKSKNLLWVGTTGGICLYNPAKDALLKISAMFNYAAELEKLEVKKILSFKADEYWIVTYKKGLLLLNTLNQTISRFFNDEITQNKVSAIVNHNGQLYISLLQQLYELRSINNTYQPRQILADYQFPEIKELFSYNNELWAGTLNAGCLRIKNSVADKKNISAFAPKAAGVGCFTADATNNLWMGTRGNGVIKYNSFTKQIQNAVHNRYDSRSIEKNFILSLFKDRQGIIWCGLSGGGVAKYDSAKFRFQNISNDPLNNTSLPDNMVFDMYAAKNNTYYIGTQNKGLSALNAQTEHFNSFSNVTNFGAIGNTIYDITQGNDENLWIASWGGLMKFNLKTKKNFLQEEKDILTSKKLYGIHKLKNSDSLFICGENGFIFFSLKEKKWKPVNKPELQLNNFIGRYIYEDDNNILWICTTGNGLIKYDYRYNHIEVIEEVKKIAGYIRHLLPDSALFILSTDNGIVLYNYKTGKVEKRISINSTRVSNVCYATLKDNNGFYWVSSNTGLYKINSKDFSSHNFDLGDGLGFLEYNTACAAKQKDGSLLFGGVGGITRFNPLQIKDNSFSPEPIITGITVNDSLIPVEIYNAGNKIISLKYNQNFITFNFAVNNFSNQHKNSFSYQLSGIDKNWVYNGNNNTASYTSLPSGDYVFQLKSANSDGIWCLNPVLIKLTIRPPWWQTWWFWLLVTLSVAGLVTFLISRRIKRIREQAGLKHKIAEVEMMALRLQMNPHFIFNSLNSINSFIVENKTHLASDYLTKFSRLMRLILENSKNESITLEKEIETLRLYLLMESVRFDNKFNHDIFIQQGIDALMIQVPPMIIQPYVENSIWHGLLHKKEKGSVLVSIKKMQIINQENLIIEILDDGIGRDEAAALKSKKSNTNKSYGMQITAQRIEQLNCTNKVDTIDLIDEKGNAKGTKVTITININ